MARYEISAPDGARYEVTAPESMSETDVMSRFQQETGQHAPQSWGGYLQGLGRQAAQGLTFSTADELEAWVRSLGGADYNATVADIRRQNEAFARENPVASISANIAGSLPLFAAGPGAAAARWAVAGGRMLPTILRSASLGAGAGALSGFGAGEGSLAERLPSAAEGAAIGAGLGAVLPPVAAGIGAAGRAVGSAVLPVLERLRPPTGGVRPEPPVPPITGRPPPIEGATFVDTVPPPEAMNAQERALTLLRDQLLRSGKSVADIEQALAEIGRARTLHSSGVAQDVTGLVDVLPEWQRLAGSIWRAHPEAAADINRFMAARQTGMTPAGADAEALAARGIPTREPLSAPMTGAQAERGLGSRFETPEGGLVPMGHVERIRDMLRRAFLISDADYHGHAGTGLRTVEQIVSGAEEAAQEAYGAAYEANAMVDLRRAVLGVFQRHIQRAALEESPNIEKYLMRVQNDLFLRPRRSIVLRQFDNSKRQLDNLITDDLAKPKYVHRGAVLTSLKNDLLDAVDTATGGEASLYRAARQEFSDKMSMARAYQLGRRALDERQTLRRTGPLAELNAGAEVTADAFRALTPGQQKLARFGILDAVTAAAMRKPREREMLQIFSQPRVQELLGAAIPRSKAAAAEFADRAQRVGRYLQAEQAMASTRNTVSGNSMTARNLQDDLALGGMEAAQQVQGFVDMFRGSTSMWNFGQKFLERAWERLFGVSADAAAEAARMLFTANPTERVRILQRIAAQMPPDRMARFNELMQHVQRFGVMPGAALGGANAGAPQGPTPL